MKLVLEISTRELVSTNIKPETSLVLLILVKVFSVISKIAPLEIFIKDSEGVRTLLKDQFSKIAFVSIILLFVL